MRRAGCAFVVLAALAAAAPASAATFYVSTTGSDASNNCQTQAAPCLTVAHAVASSETTPGLGTIDLAPSVLPMILGGAAGPWCSIVAGFGGPDDLVAGLRS
jgi:hypothetical protein